MLTPERWQEIREKASRIMKQTLSLDLVRFVCDVDELCAGFNALHAKLVACEEQVKALALDWRKQADWYRAHGLPIGADVSLGCAINLESLFNLPPPPAAKEE